MSLSTCETKSSSKYLKGLAKVWVKVRQQDNECFCVFKGETLEGATARGAATLSVVSTPVCRGAASIEVVNTAAGDGIDILYSPATDLSSVANSFLALDVYATSAGTVVFGLTDGTNVVSATATVVANQCQRLVLDTSTAPVGFDWTAVTGAFVESGTITGNFYVDSLKLFCSLSDMEQDYNALLACTQELGMDVSEDFAILKCNGKDTVAKDSNGKEITLNGTLSDFDAAAMAAIGQGDVSTDGAVRLVDGELFTPTAGTYTLESAANLVSGDGFGVWVYDATDTSRMLQSYPDANNVPAGYYNLDPVTGVLTFNAAENGRSLAVTYNVSVPNGTVYTIFSKSDSIEVMIQFAIKGPNGTEVLFVFPRVSTSLTGINMEAEDFWTWEFEGTVLADKVTGALFQIHQ